jgi:hypothetical protein
VMVVLFSVLGFHVFQIFIPQQFCLAHKISHVFVLFFFYLCAKNTIVLAIVYGPKFFTRKENPKQVNLEFV